jgi:hypothetical protein
MNGCSRSGKSKRRLCVPKIAHVPEELPDATDRRIERYCIVLRRIVSYCVGLLMFAPPRLELLACSSVVG